MPLYEIVRTVLIAVIILVFAVASLAATVRVIRGPSIVDRMIGADTLMTILITVIVADMVVRGHTDTLVLVLVLAGVASVGTLAVARFTSRSTPHRPDAGGRPDRGPVVGSDSTSASGATGASAPWDVQP